MTRGPVYEGNYKVYFAASNGVVDIEAPTLAEIAAATYLGRLIMKDGVAFGISQNRVEANSIDEKFDSQRMGTWKAEPTITLFRDDADETDGYDLVANGTVGFLIVVPFGEAEDGDPAYVFPVEMGVAQPADSAGNAPQSFRVDFAVTSEPALAATVAAS